MKTYQIRVNDREYTVEIEDLSASPVVVTVDGKPFEVTISQQGTQVDSRYRTAGQPTPGDASPPPDPDHDALLDTYVPMVASTYIAAPDMAPEPEASEATDAGSPDATPPRTHSDARTRSDARMHSDALEAITAPMPGTILDIAAKPGDVVQQGDTLCNLEAMKMKSPIRSPIAGTVAQVLISEGQNVGHGDVLFTVRP